MPDHRAVVTNTTPLIALAAARGELDALRVLYERVIVPFEVEQELLAAGVDSCGAKEFLKANWLERRTAPVAIPNYLRNALDQGRPPSYKQRWMNILISSISTGRSSTSN